MKWRLAAGVVFFAAQVLWPMPLRTWAPFHEHAVYSLSVDANGEHLGTRAALERYRLSSWYFSPARDENWETNELDFVKQVIVATEARSSGPVRVTLRARVDGAAVPDWSYSPR